MTKLEGADVLVTGAGGFVGAHVLRTLVACGARVHATVIAEPAPSATLASWHRADLTDPQALRTAVSATAPDFVVHLAGQASAGLSFEQPLETFRVNAVGTWNLLEAVKAAAPAARVLVVGSADVYGPQPEHTYVREDAPLRPVSPYALSKAAADAFAELAAHDGLDVVRTRSFAHAGAGQAPRFVLPSWARQIAAIERGEAEPVIRVGNLTVTRDLTDVRDVARAYVMLLERGVRGAAYNVCRGSGVRLDAVLERMSQSSTARFRIEPDPARLRAADLPWLVGSPLAIERDTGWKAEIPLDETLAAVLEDARRAATAV
jgi:GDP-4-dehydro-6-deoxy-D-mannose reductase